MNPGSSMCGNIGRAKDRVIAAAQDPSIADRHQGSAAGGNDVKALVGAPAAAGGAELADRAAGAVWPLDGEDVAEIGDGAVIGGDPSRGRGGQDDS
jgi:hypothetical protein